MGQAENKVQKAIKEYLEWHGYTVYRVNNSGTYNQERKQYIFHGTKGLPDLIALKKGKYALFIECKSAKGKQTKEQIEFDKLMNNTIGTFSLCVHSLDEFDKFFNPEAKKYFILDQCEDIGSERNL